MNSLLLRLLLAACLAGAAAPSLAHGRDGDPAQRSQPPGVTVPDWDQLSPDQQQGLARLREQWDQLPASRRALALERLERRQRWEAMSPEQREHIRRGARIYRNLSPEQREKLKVSMRTLRSLPEPERRQLFARWRELDPKQRRAWLEAGGPGIAPEPDYDAPPPKQR